MTCSDLVERQAGRLVHEFGAKMRQVNCNLDNVKRVEADSNTFEKQKGT